MLLVVSLMIMEQEHLFIDDNWKEEVKEEEKVWGVTFLVVDRPLGAILLVVVHGCLWC